MKAVIFDLDGVIVHTDKYHYLSWKALADRLNIYFDETINNRCRGVSRMDSLEIILEKADEVYSQADKLAFAEEKNSIYRQYLMSMTEKDVSDDVRNTLLRLKENGVKIAIGSSSKNAKLILERVGLLNLFDAISDGNGITHSKPHPEVFLNAAKMLNIDPSDCAIVEDAYAGIQAGKSAEMTTIAIGDATSCKLADYNIKSLSEIINIVTK